MSTSNTPYLLRRLRRTGPAGPAGPPGPASAALDNAPVGTPTMVVGAEAANVITVAVQLKDSDAVNLTRSGSVWMYLSMDSAGDVPFLGSDDVTPAAGTDGNLLTSDDFASGVYSWLMRSEADGAIDVLLQNAVDITETYYLNVINALGVITTSGPIAFVDDTP